MSPDQQPRFSTNRGMFILIITSCYYQEFAIVDPDNRFGQEFFQDVSQVDEGKEAWLKSQRGKCGKEQFSPNSARESAFTHSGKSDLIPVQPICCGAQAEDQ